MPKTAHPPFEIPANTGRDLSAAELGLQIGMPNLLAVSGGRVRVFNDSTVGFPCGAGFEVLVTLESDDTYTVRRLFRRAGKWFLHGERTDVYFDEISEVVYYASCFRSYEAGDWEHRA